MIVRLIKIKLKFVFTFISRTVIKSVSLVIREIMVNVSTHLQLLIVIFGSSYDCVIKLSHLASFIEMTKTYADGNLFIKTSLR